MKDETINPFEGRRPATLPNMGMRLRQLRRIRGVKQGAVADLAGVTQPTISRWEKGELEPEAALAHRLLAELGGKDRRFGDGSLRRVIESSPLSVHLIGDLDHRLFAASRPREREWGQSVVDLLGQSLWHYATDSIRAAEVALEEAGWWNDSIPVPVMVQIGEGHAGLQIAPGLMLWERLYLADGTPVRICTNVGSI